MGYREAEFSLCKQCWARLKKPSKKEIKKMELTSYKDMCAECKRMDRIVEYIWEPDEDSEGEV